MHRMTAVAVLSIIVASVAARTAAAQSCDAIRSRYDDASPNDFPSKHDADKEVTTWSTRLPNRAYGDFTGMQIEASASGKDSIPGNFVLTYTRTYAISDHLMSPMPTLKTTSVLHVVIDTLTLNQKGATYDKGGTIMGIVRSDLVRDRLSFPVTPDVIRALADARKVQFAVDKDKVVFDKGRLQRGAQAIVIGMACGWKDE